MRKPADPLIVPMDKYDVHAVQALARGNASEAQQKRALAYIVNTLAATYDLSFRPGGPEAERATCLAEGRRFVGLRLVMMTKLPAEAVERLGPKG
jgi:hypothetical protein